MPDLSEVEAMVVDMDGVLWRGKSILPGVPEFFELLRKRPYPFLLATNNATATPRSVVSRLDSLGITISSEEVLTSSQAAASYVGETIKIGSQIYTIGEASLQDALIEAGFNLTNTAEEARAVVVGYDRGLNFAKLTEAVLAVQFGATFVGTNPDRTFPIERGQAPGNGAILAAIQTATGVDPIIVGKPEPHLYNQAKTRLGTAPQHILAIGDRLETDILGGTRASMSTALLLTGVTNLEDLERSEIQPDFVFGTLFELVQAFEGRGS